MSFEGLAVAFMDFGPSVVALARKTGKAERLAHHQACGCVMRPAASSMTLASEKSVSSSKGRPMSCRPSGKPSADNPPGTARPGKPAIFTVTVKTSLRYISTGSAPLFSPIPKAGDGVAGVGRAARRVADHVGDVVGGGGGQLGPGPGCTTTNGSAGGTSSIASGTQTISTVSATGGAGGQYNGSGGEGSGSGGDINSSGWGRLASAISAGAPSIYGSGIAPGAGGSGNSWNGAAGGAAIKFFTGLTPGNTIAVTVGGGGYSTSVYGSAGVVVFEW